MPEVTGEDGLRALQLVDQIHQAFKDSLSAIEGGEQELAQFMSAEASL